MNQATSGVIFSNTSSGNSGLYVSTQPANEWVAILLPKGSTYTESTIDLATAATQEVFFLFAVIPPANVDDFIKNYQPFLNAVRRQYIQNLTMAWLSSPDSLPSAQNTVIINFTQNNDGSFGVGQTFNFIFGSNFASLNIVNNTAIQFIPENAPDTLQLIYTPPPNNTPNMSFASTTIGSNSLFDSSINIPFSGSGAGSFKFLLGFNMNSDFTAYNLQNNYYYLDADEKVQCLSYPVLSSGSNNEFVITQTQINPLDITNTNGLNTYFAITDTIYNSQTGNTTATQLPSNYAINTGYPLTLWPLSTFTSADAGSSNNIYPETDCARFVLSPQDAAGIKKYYLVPEGNFYLDPGSSQAAFADENGQFNFLPGLSGTEVITFTPYTNSGGTITGDQLQFKSKQAAFAPNFPSQPVSLANPGTNTPLLDTTFLTSWANIVSYNNSDDVQYASQPQGASLYAKGHGLVSPGSNITGFLGFYEPSVNMPSAPDFYVPVVPYLGIATIPSSATANINTFESKILSAERKQLITNSFSTYNASKSKAKRQLLASANDADNYTASTTPQGLVANVKDNGSWSLLNLAQNTVNNGTPEYLTPDGIIPTGTGTPQYQLSFTNISTQLQSAFLTNQQFLVMTNKQYLGTLFSSIKDPIPPPFQGPVFNNKMSIEDWPFDINVGTKNTYADYNNVVIFKFCEGTLLDRVKNPKDWTQADAFNIASTQNDSADSYNQLVAISSWLQNYLQAAEDAYAVALKNPAWDQAKYYQKFHEIINNKNWNGILILKADINLQQFPQQLKGLISGINLNYFNAHHIGIEVNRIDASGTITMDPVSSLFGLINYTDAAYGLQIVQGSDPNKPVPPLAGVNYDFKVLYLQVLFENTAIKDFSSKIQLTMNNLFSDKVIGTNNPYGATNLNTVVLNGTYQDHNGTPVYVFDNKDDNLFYFDSNLLQNVEITQVQFNTLTTDPKAVAIESRFLMWGYLNFGVMSNTIQSGDDPPEPVTYTLDAFSFGQANGDKSPLQFGLNYSSLYINMGFELTNPAVVTYAFDAEQIAFNSSQSTSRQNSLYPNFALQINNLLSGNDDSPPSGLGYLTLALPNINATGLSGDWYGLEMTLNLGTPGELASSLGFNASLLLAWSPGSKSVVPSYNTLIGIKLPGTSSNAKLLSIQGVLKLTIDKLRLQYVEDQQSYLLTLSNIALKFLGILKLPPGGNTNFLLFGNPNPGATSKSLGWYAAYNKSE